jgi:uncharacterized membrane protein
MNLAPWILQVVLAVSFALAGVMKLTQLKEKLVGRLPWVQDLSPATVKLIGTAQGAAALGLILPAATGIASGLVVLIFLAATGLVVLMVLAAITPARRKEPRAIAFNAVPLVLAAVVAVVAGLASAHTPSHQRREHPTAQR